MIRGGADIHRLLCDMINTAAKTDTNFSSAACLNFNRVATSIKDLISVERPCIHTGKYHMLPAGISPNNKFI